MKGSDKTGKRSWTVSVSLPANTHFQCFLETLKGICWNESWNGNKMNQSNRGLCLQEPIG